MEHTNVLDWSCESPDLNPVRNLNQELKFDVQILPILKCLLLFMYFFLWSTMVNGCMHNIYQLNCSGPLEPNGKPIYIVLHVEHLLLTTFVNCLIHWLISAVVTVKKKKNLIFQTRCNLYSVEELNQPYQPLSTHIFSSAVIWVAFSLCKSLEKCRLSQSSCTMAEIQTDCWDHNWSYLKEQIKFYVYSI